MTMSQALLQSGAIDSMARDLGVDSRTAQTAAGALLPAIVAGLGRNHVGAGGTRSHGGGLADILGGLAGGGGGGLLDQVLGQAPTPKQPGNDILGQIFGSKDVSRGVADEVAQSTGLDSGLLKKMLPMLAMAVVGMMLKQGGGGGMAQPGSAGVGGPLGGALGGGLGGILGQVVGGMMRR